MGYIQLPGLADVHVHLREPGALQKEDFTTGTKAAIAGGYTQILDMPNNNPPTINRKNLEDKKRLAKDRIYCDLGFNFGATADSIVFFNKVSAKTFGLKVYMSKTTGPLLVNDNEERDLIFKSWENPSPIMVHALDETLQEAINLAKKYKRRIHVCHITTNQISMLKRAKNQGLEISSEVCPHHLFLNTNDIKTLGPFGMMKPPLMSKKDQEELWNHLDVIDMISTDHAPHTISEKEDKTSPKYGVPGLETTVPLMLSAVSKKLITLKRLTEMLSTSPKKIFGLPEQKNTHIVIDTSKKYKIGSKKLFTKCNWTPFKELMGQGNIHQVFLRGEKIFEGGKFLTKPKGIVMGR
ncbi:MAG: amidohydrolase family protein [Patescibacteria group bacterium]